MIHSRKTKIQWKTNKSWFEKINKKAFDNNTRRIGKGLTQLNTLCSYEEEMKAYLPLKVGGEPGASGFNWKNAVTDFWNKFSILVEPEGKSLDISFDIDYIRFKDNINNLLKRMNYDITGKSNKDIEQSVINYIFVENNVDERELYLYGFPVNLDEYLEFRFCLLSNEVANNPEDIHKSSKIRFFLYDETQERLQRKQKLIKENEAINEYSKLHNDPQFDIKVQAIAVLSNKMSYKKAKGKNNDIADIELEVIEFLKNKPIEFLTILNDTSLLAKCFIKGCIEYGILKYLNTDTIIVDSTNIERVLGHDISAAVTYLHLEENKNYLSELKIKLQSLNN